MFSNIAYPIALQHGLIGSASHMDTSTLSLHGVYSESQAKDTESSSDNLPTPVVNHGHSKAKRPDLKQVVLNMATTGAAGFPIWMEAHSGNASDQVVLHESFQRMDTFVKSMKHSSNLLYVADSDMATLFWTYFFKQIFSFAQIPQVINNCYLSVFFCDYKTLQYTRILLV